MKWQTVQSISGRCTPSRACELCLLYQLTVGISETEKLHYLMWCLSYHHEKLHTFFLMWYLFAIWYSVLVFQQTSTATTAQPWDYLHIGTEQMIELLHGEAENNWAPWFKLLVGYLTIFTNSTCNALSRLCLPCGVSLCKVASSSYKLTMKQNRGGEGTGSACSSAQNSFSPGWVHIWWPLNILATEQDEPMYHWCVYQVEWFIGYLWGT